jgi:ribose transport system permease protein
MNLSPSPFRALLSDHGKLLVLLLLVAVLSVVTYGEQQPTGDAAARELGPELQGKRVLIVVRDGARDGRYAERLKAGLTAQGVDVVGAVRGQPPEARAEIAKLARRGVVFDAYVVTAPTAVWTIYDRLAKEFPRLGSASFHQPTPYSWPTFLTADNLLNVANQIAVIALMAIGMTMVIIVGGIDLSVGSLVALAAVVTALSIRDLGGAEEASDAAMVLSACAGMAACGLFGMFSGTMITRFGMPAFIVTLGVLWIASGLAGVLSQNQSIYQLPESFAWLGGEADLFGIPNAVVLMVLLYFLAHFMMTRTILGRYIYAVGGNAQAARYSGVPVRRVTIIVYTISGILAGLGGVMLASQLRSASPNYGRMYELSVIASVVVGGTSLSGGKGSVVGTLIGALIIGVIRNGMNLMGLESDVQSIVLGAVLLLAVLLDRLAQGKGQH